MDNSDHKIDFNYLDNMLRLSKGNPRFVTEMVNRFIKTSTKDMADIRSFKNTMDRESLKQRSHKFISSCSVVGAMQMIEICHLLSKKSDGETNDMINARIDELDREYDYTLKSLQDYLNKLYAAA